MNRAFRVLILEDVTTDAELTERELRKAHLDFTPERVETKEAYLRALAEFRPDIILSDFGLPQFNGLEALRLLKGRNVDAPFILVTGSLTEEVAVECMKEGASDYVLKTSLRRLPSAVLNALERAEARRSREEAIEALRRSEEQYRLITEHTRDLISVLDLHGDYVYASPSYKATLGYEPESLLGTNALARAHREDREELVRTFEAALRDREGRAAEYRLQHRDGDWLHFEARGSWVFDPEGEPVTAVIVSRDITGRKLAEEALRQAAGELALTNQLLKEEIVERQQAIEALRESEERFHSAFTDAAIGMALVGLEGRWLQVNRSLCEFVGYPERELLATDFQSVTHPADLERDVANRRRMLAGEISTFNMEKRYLHKLGHAVWGLLSLSLVRDARGAPLYFIAQVQDITERKRAEIERDAERRLLDALFDQLPVGVLLRDNRGRYTQANRMAAHITGIERERLLGMSVDEVAALIDISDTERRPLDELGLPSTAAILTHQPIGPRSFLITTPAGDERRLVASAAPVVFDGQGVLSSVIVISDVTEQHAIQEQLRQSQKMESIGVLAGGVAHDFNNLLTAITGNTQLALRKLPADDPVQQRLVEVEKAAQRAAVLTRQLLAFSRRQHLERRTLNLGDTINEVMKMVRRIIGEDVEVQIKGGKDLAPVFADPTQIEQVVMNLAVNARDAMPGGGGLTVETRNVELDEAYCRRYSYVQPGRYVLVRVSDTGTGMDAETQARIFEPFFTTKEVGKGTGLGLAMVYGIVKQHEGHINVYSEPGHGTTFNVYFPVAVKAAAKEDAPTQAPLLGGTETILVAEDEESLRGLAQAVLEGLGYRVMLAKNGEEAVAIYKAERGRIDMLMFDVVMPRMGGYEAYSRIKAMGDDIPAIFVTGYSTETVQSRFVKQNKFFDEEGTVLIQKPYNVEGLGRKVREVLDEAKHGAAKPA
jgi:PAS domain S-box-containing protein